MLDSFVGQKVVMDLRSTFVCLGTLASVGEKFLELKNADIHDLRDTQTSRENYVAASVATGIKRNRKRVLVNRDDLVAISDAVFCLKKKTTGAGGRGAAPHSRTPSPLPATPDRTLRPASTRAIMPSHYYSLL